MSAEGDAGGERKESDDQEGSKGGGGEKGGVASAAGATSAGLGFGSGLSRPLPSLYAAAAAAGLRGAIRRAKQTVPSPSRRYDNTAADAADEDDDDDDDKFGTHAAVALQRRRQVIAEAASRHAVKNAVQCLERGLRDW